MRVDLWKLGVQVLLEGDAEFLTEGLEFVEVLLVLARVFDFCFDSCWEVSAVLGGEGRYRMEVLGWGRR